MKTLGKLLGSSARTDILCALCYQTEAVGLRQVARIADVQPHSADLALQGLVREKLVTCVKSSARNAYRLNHHHPHSSVLLAMFDAVARAKRDIGRPALSKRALILLPFIEEAKAMLSHARKGGHVESQRPI